MTIELTCTWLHGVAVALAEVQRKRRVVVKLQLRMRLRREHHVGHMIDAHCADVIAMTVDSRAAITAWSQRGDVLATASGVFTQLYSHWTGPATQRRPSGVTERRHLLFERSGAICVGRLFRMFAPSDGHVLHPLGVAGTAL